MSAIAVIRMKGKFSLAPDIVRTLSALRLGRLYACTILPAGESSRGMLQACKDAVSFGEVNADSVALLLQKRGRDSEGKKLSESRKPEEIKKLAQEIAGGKALESAGVYPVFFLSPPKGGFGSRKSQAPFGPLGKNAQISELISRMA